MSMNFPNTPAVGDKYGSYIWDGEKWETTIGGGSGVVMADTPPSAPSNGDLWWDTSAGVMYVYFQDVDSSQWVIATPWQGEQGVAGPTGPQGPIGLTGPPGPVPEAPLDGKKYARQSAAWTEVGGAAVLVSDSPPVGAADNSLWVESDTGLMYLRYNDGTSAQWILIPPGVSAASLSAVTYVPQTLTTPQQAQATTNIGAVAKTGSTMIGTLTVTLDNPYVYLNKTNVLGDFAIVGQYNGKHRWLLDLASGVTEGGSNSGSGFQINRYNDAGGYLGTPFSISRASGGAVFEAGVSATTINGTALNVSGGILTVRSDLTNGPFNCAMYVNFTGNGSQYGISMRPQQDSCTAINFANAANTSIGSIGLGTTVTSFNTSSDARLKDDFADFDAGLILDRIVVYDFAWKATGERAHGVVAQEVQKVFPAAVTCAKQDDTDEEWWGVDYSKFVPLLLQEIKSLRERVAALEAK